MTRRQATRPLQHTLVKLPERASRKECPDCFGAGQLFGAVCAYCEGRGLVPVERSE